MKVKTVARCPHCDKALRVREVDIDKASQEELREFFRLIMNPKD
ncbi:MAG: hypothetical protein V3V85_03600 [Candidatus Thorarchaeota archaeon]